MDKKQKERTILNMIYTSDNMEDIVAFENPDFKLKPKFELNYFGVEITNFYYSESSARIENVYGYFQEILNHKHYRHKKDVKNLKLQKFTLLKPDGTPVEEVEGIYQKYPSIKEYTHMISNLISKKDKRYHDYSGDLSHVNLIIYDRSHKLTTISRQNFYNIFFIEPLIKTLRSSKFAEIFFITTLDNNPNKLVYIPLKLLLFASQYFLYEATLSHCYKKVKFNCNNEMLILFANYLQYIGVQNVFVSEIDNHFQIICGRYGVLFYDNGELSIVDYTSSTLPKDVLPFTLKDSHSIIDDEFVKKIIRATRNSSFKNNFVFDVNSSSV